MRRAQKVLYAPRYFLEPQDRHMDRHHLPQPWTGTTRQEDVHPDGVTAAPCDINNMKN